MKKLLISLALFAMAVAVPAQAAVEVWSKDGHKLEIGADIHFGGFIIGVASDQKTLVDFNDMNTPDDTSDDVAAVGNRIAAQDPFQIKSKGELDFKFGGNINPNLSYGAKLEIRPDVNGSDLSIDVDEYYAFLKDKRFGQLYIGMTKSPASKRHVRAPEFYLKDLNSIEGQDFKPLDKLQSIRGGVEFFAVKDETDIDYDEDLHKVIYYTPRYFGVEFGIAYAPDIENADGKGDSKIALNNEKGSIGRNAKILPDDDDDDRKRIKNAISLSVNSAHNVGGFDLELSFGYFTAEAVETGKGDPSALNFGGQIGIPLGSGKVKIGGGYLLAENVNGFKDREDSVLIAGVAYSIGDIKAGVHYRFGVEERGLREETVNEIEFGGSYAFNKYTGISSGIELVSSEVEVKGANGYKAEAEGIAFNAVFTVRF